MTDSYNGDDGHAALDHIVEQAPKRGRRPSLVADERTLALLSGLRQIMCTKVEAAAVLHVARNTFDRFLEENEEAREVWEEGEGIGKMSLRRKQFKLADRNAAMAIFLGKNYLNQKDNYGHGGPDGGPIPVNFGRLTDAQLASFIARIDETLGAPGGEGAGDAGVGATPPAGD